MASTKTRAIGLCGACGAMHRLNKAGRLVAHGYRRDYSGSLGDVCEGTGCLPFEVSPESAQKQMQRILATFDDMNMIAKHGARMELKRLEASIAKWRPKTVKTFQEEAAEGSRSSRGGMASLDDPRNKRRSTHDASEVRRMPGFRPDREHEWSKCCEQSEKNAIAERRRFAHKHLIVTVGGVAYHVYEDNLILGGKGFHLEGEDRPVYLGATKEETVANLERLQRGEAFKYWDPFHGDYR